MGPAAVTRSQTGAVIRSPAPAHGTRLRHVAVKDGIQPQQEDGDESVILQVRGDPTRT